MSMAAKQIQYCKLKINKKNKRPQENFDDEIFTALIDVDDFSYIHMSTCIKLSTLNMGNFYMSVTPQ